MRRSLLALALVGILILTTTAQESRPLRIGFVTSSADDYWKIVEAGADKAALEAKAELIVKRPSDGSVDLQTKLIDELVADKIDGLVVSLLNFDQQAASMAKIGRGMPLSFYNCDLTGTGRVLAVASDHKQGGRLGAQLVREACPKGATIVLFTGTSQTSFSQQRFQALAADLGIADPEKDTTSKDGKYRLLHKEPIQDGLNPKQARENVLETLTRLKADETFCLIGLWAYHAPAILEAVKEKNLTGKVVIIAFDEQADTFTGIEDGQIFATIIQNPELMAYKTTKAVLAKAGNKPIQLPSGGFEWIPHRIVTKAGGPGRIKCADRYEELRKILAP
jgi:ribose transport system substrate-binding protein